MERINLSVSDDEEGELVAYLELPGHPGSPGKGCVKKNIRLRDVLGAYDGPDLYFDFDAENRLIGIEILE